MTRRAASATAASTPDVANRTSAVSTDAAISAKNGTAISANSTAVAPRLSARNRLKRVISDLRR